MPKFYLVLLLICFSPFWAHAQESDDSDVHVGGQMGAPVEVQKKDYIEILAEEDQASIAELRKLQEEIPAAEKNCIRIKKDQRSCRCDSAYLYKDYDRIIEDIVTRHPDWENRTLKYNFFWEGVTYEGTSDLEKFRFFSDKFRVLHCDEQEE